MSKIAIIYGSSRPSNKGAVIAKWINNELDNKADLIDLKEVNLPFIDEPVPPIAGEYEHDHTKKWSEEIKQYDGYIFVAAEYNLGYTPILKNAIDTLFHEWNKKSAAIVSYGSYPESTAAKQLRTVLTPFKMNVVEENVHITPVSEAVIDDQLDESAVKGDIEKLLKDFEKLLK